MRRLLLAFVFAPLLALQAASDVVFEHVWPQYRDAQSFDRIRTYFGGSADESRQTVLRSQAESYDGLFFLVRVKSPRPLNAARFILEIIRPDSPDAKRYTFTASLPAKSHVAELGLTGTDWAGGPDVHPVAWKVTLLDANGEVLASQPSFLWEKPA